MVNGRLTLSATWVTGMRRNSLRATRVWSSKRHVWFCEIRANQPNDQKPPARASTSWSMRYLCVHSHCYQPPRENPWLEAIELQDSAYPYHDWNERIMAECYAPNTAARILGPEQRILKIVNNYANTSFNFGPTLLSWMKDKAPEGHQAILDADRLSAERFSGHGSALSQCYNHMIMPLAN